MDTKEAKTRNSKRGDGDNNDKRRDKIPVTIALVGDHSNHCAINKSRKPIQNPVIFGLKIIPDTVSVIFGPPSHYLGL